LQGQKSLFLRTKIYLFFIVFLLSIAGCSSANLWNIPKAAFKEKIKNGNFTFLLNLDYKELKLEDIRKMGPEAPYFFYYIFKKLKMNDKALSMLRIAWRKSPEVWNKKAGLALITELIKKDDYEEAVNIADKYLKKYSEPEAVKSATRLKLEALYWQKKDRDVLRMLAMEREYLNPEKDTELKLFRAVASCRLKINDWPNLFRSLFFNEKYSYLHSRAYAFLRLQNSRLESFLPWELDLFHAKDLLARGKKTEALSLYEKAFSRGYEKIFAESTVSIDDYVFSSMTAGLNRRGAEFLFKLSGKLKTLAGLSAAELAAEEMAARLYRKTGMFKRAQELLDNVINLTLNDSQRDRALWFMISIDGTRSYVNAYRTVISTYALWSSPEYFSDILDNLVSELVYHREWKKLYTVYRVTEKNGPEDITSRSLHILKSVSSSKLIDIENLKIENSSDRDIFSYYALLDYFAGRIGNETSENLKEMLDRPDKKAAKKGKEQESEEFALVNGFLSFGMADRAYREAMENSEKFKGDELFKIALSFMHRGFFRKALNLNRLYLKNKEGKPTIAELKAFFPEIYTDSIEKYSKRDNIPAFILYSLVREESHFDKDIISRAGAVGLMQLLPITAEDSAKKLKLKNINLKDPDENINLGTKHLGNLYRRLENMPKAILAYNAGLKRLRAWEKELKGLPVELFIEAVPYRETRDYFKKIFISSVFYAVLYDKLSVNQVKDYFFLTR